MALRDKVSGETGETCGDRLSPSQVGDRAGELEHAVEGVGKCATCRRSARAGAERAEKAQRVARASGLRLGTQDSTRSAVPRRAEQRDAAITDRLYDEQAQRVPPVQHHAEPDGEERVGAAPPREKATRHNNQLNGDKMTFPRGWYVSPHNFSIIYIHVE